MHRSRQNTVSEKNIGTELKIGTDGDENRFIILDGLMLIFARLSRNSLGF
jgi:hypothetical protein